jgi:putative transposase
MLEPTVIHHIWFATKRRKWLLQGDVDEAAKGLLREAACRHGIDLLDCETGPDHVHLLLRIPRSQSLPKVMNLLKGASARRLHQMFPETKLDSGSDHFWQRGYASAVVSPASLATRRRYVQTQKERLEKYERP